ncbi:unnamed protein product [Linum trigynum]|uniref:Uncharacterized protein n=1 Tax=Linum trigynum TaxID=586398 RepID=A0AAV2E0I3_9ROSI
MTFHFASINTRFKVHGTSGDEVDGPSAHKIDAPHTSDDGDHLPLLLLDKVNEQNATLILDRVREHK